jgi:ribosomal protein S18 acetylase RimI-like enzyme
MDSVLIRPASDADLDAIVRCHIDVWRETYAGLVAPEIAARLTDFETRERRWREMLCDQGADRQALAAEAGGAIAGFGMHGRGDEGIFGASGEIKYLYVARTHQGRGIGRKLMAAMAEALRRRGYRSIALAVVRGNTSAIGFYESLGGAHAGDFTDPGPLWRSDNLLYRWDDLPALIAHCAPEST